MKARSWLSPIIVTGLTLIVSVVLMLIYRHNVLADDLDNHILSAKVFGMPRALLDHGLVPFYQGKESGWDGQFYYYIANDPLDRADTADHLDADAYRYQRIGLPLLAWIASKAAFRDWVSPTTYYLTNLGLILFATLVGTLYLRRVGTRPEWILFWSLSLGVQLTVLNALPDGAADALLLVALVCLFCRQRAGFAVIATLASLAREAYVIVPMIYLLVSAYETVMSRRARTTGPTMAATDWGGTAIGWLRTSAWPAIVPVAIFAAWQLFLRLRFHHAPSSQALGILAPPFQKWFLFLADSLREQHPIVLGARGYWEAAGLVAFMLLLAGNAWLAFRAFRRSTVAQVEVRTLALSLLVLCVLYACFGEVVMTIYFGYMKAAGIFILAVPFLLAWCSRGGKVTFVLLFVATDVLMAAYLWDDRINVPSVDFDRYVRLSQVTSHEPTACLKDYRAQVALVGIEDVPGSQSLMSKLTGERLEIARIAVTNASEVAYRSSTTAGSVNVSYHWLTADGKTVVKDGRRSFMPEGLAAHATAVVPVVIDFPDQPGRYTLRLTLVQEGCAWFYNIDPTSKYDVDYVLH